MKTLFFDQRHVLFVTIATVLVAGVSAFVSLPRLEDPRITNRNPVVLTPVPGATAERVESLVTEKLETALEEISEIKEIRSTSRAGFSLLAIELDDAVSPGENERIFARIRDQLAEAEASLPPDAEAPELDDQRDPVAFTRIAAVTWSGEDPAPMGILTRLAEALADRLRNVRGTELVRVYGGVEEEILVELDQREAAALGLGPAEVAAALASADTRESAGVLRARGRDLQVGVEGSFSATERIGRVPLRDGEGQALALVDDVARVSRSWEDPPVEIGLVDGRRGVYVAARMAADAQVGRWSEDVAAALDELRSMAGGEIGVEDVFDQSRYTEERLGELGLNLLLGVGVVVAVVVLTMGLRSALIVGSAIPLVAAATLFGVLAAGGAMHQMSIFGMIIGLGLLIDNAIVVTDEIRKRRARGLAARPAVGETLGHLAGPLLASTLTTALAFAPIVLLPGNAGDFVGWIGGSVILAIVSSYVLSMTVVAALAGRYGGSGGGGGRGGWLAQGVPGGRVGGWSRRALTAGLSAPVALMLLAAAPSAAGFAVGPHLGRQFFPPVDRDMADLRVWLPRGTSVDRTRELVTAIDGALREDERVERVHWLIGGSFPRVYYNLLMNRDRSSDFAQAAIDATSAADVEAMIPAMQRSLDERFPGAQVVLRSFGQGPPVDADIEFKVYGPSVERLTALTERIRVALQAHPAVLHTRTSTPRGSPKVWYDADERAARVSGFGLGALAEELRGQLDGATGGSVVEGPEELAVRVRVAGVQRSTVEGLASGRFPREAGSWAPAGSLGSFELRPETAGLTRVDGVRAAIVEGYTREGTLPIDVTRDVESSLEAAGFSAPLGYRVELGGSLEADQEAVANLATYAPVLGVLMLAALVLTFQSVTLAGVLLAVGGLSVGLALLSTWSIGFPVSFNTILGTLGLIGVAFNDSIVVIAAIREDPEARRGDRAAIARAVMGCTRHVISTTLTTIGGFLPLLLLVGGDFWPSLAIVLAGGVGGATLLAVVFVPAAYRLLATRGLVNA